MRVKRDNYQIIKLKYVYFLSLLSLLAYLADNISILRENFAYTKGSIEVYSKKCEIDHLS